MIFVNAVRHKMAELMSNTSQQRLEILEHTSRQIDSLGLHAGEGKFSLVRMKGLAHFQKFLMFENDNGQPIIGVGGPTQIVA